MGCGGVCVCVCEREREREREREGGVGVSLSSPIKTPHSCDRLLGLQRWLLQSRARVGGAVEPPRIQQRSMWDWTVNWFIPSVNVETVLWCSDSQPGVRVPLGVRKHTAGGTWKTFNNHLCYVILFENHQHGGTHGMTNRLRGYTRQKRLGSGVWNCNGERCKHTK